VTPARRAELTRQPQPAINFRSLQQALVRPRVGPLFHVRFMFGMAFSMFQSIFALYAAGAPLNLTPRGTGFVLTYVGVLAVIVQGFLVGRLAQRYADKAMIVVCSVIMAVSLLAWGLAPNLVILLIVMAPLAFAGGILNTVINSALSKAVYPEEVGGTLGLSASLESLTRTLSPSIGGYLLGQFGVIGPAVFSAGVMGWVVSFAYRRLIVNPDPPLTPRAGGPDVAPLQPSLH
jgi:MFS family permease